MEASLSHGMQPFGLQRGRSIGLAEAHLRYVITFATMHLARSVT